MVPESVMQIIGANTEAKMVSFAYDAETSHLYDLQQYNKGTMRKVGRIDLKTKRVYEN